jgi:predicted  nucleic acid-binding Zn-ribbon protein
VSKARKKRPTADLTRAVRMLRQRVERICDRLDALEHEIPRLERARQTLSDRLKLMEDTRPAWAKDARGNPLPVYTHENLAKKQ